MKLLILTPEYAGSGGGIMTFYQHLAPALVRRGVQVRVVEGSGFSLSDDAEPAMINGVAVERLERARFAAWWDRFQEIGAAPTLRRHLAAAWAAWEQSGAGEEADIIEASDWGLLFVPPIVEPSRPVVVQCHASVGQIAAHDPVSGERADDGMLQLIERAVLSKARSVQTYSSANAQFWEGEAGRTVDVLRPAWSVPRPAVSSTDARGLVVGRLQRWKGPQVVCAALDLLGSAAPEIEWIGRDTPWEHRNQSAAAHLAEAFPNVWAKKLKHQPPISAAEVARRQTEALFNLVPSTWDVFNFTVVEAMASGRPVIASTGAGASELIEDGDTGFLFPADDAEALAATIERIMSTSPTRLAEIGKAARESVRTALDPDRIAGERIAAYQATMDDFERSPPKPIDGWLRDACCPSGKLPQDGMAFLDHHSLRSILSYSARRFRRRLRSQ